MVQPDAHEIRSGVPAADAIPANQRPAFDSNRRWYDEYLDLLHRANDLVVDTVQLRRQIDTLHQALVIVLEETDGGSFLSAQTRDLAQDLIKKYAAGVPTELRVHQQR